MAQKKKAPLKAINKSPLNRTLTITRLVLSSGAKSLTRRFFRNVGKSEGADPQKDNHNSNYFLNGSDWDVISEQIGMLKGSVMKIGQMISVYGEYFLPKELNDKIKTLQSQSPPFEFSEILKELEKSLQKSFLKSLEIDPNPIGAASLGQVHKAYLKKGRENHVLALKVKYPGVEEAIESDLRVFKAALKLFSFYKYNENYDGFFSEVAKMLHQELNYTEETKNALKYKSLLNADKRFYIPAIYPEWSTKNVIVSEYCPGERFDSKNFISLPIEVRNAVGRNFLELFFKELFEWGVVQTDPHLGNFAYRYVNDLREPQIILYDFGALKTYDEKFLRPYYKMVDACLKFNSFKLRQAALQLSILRSDDPIEIVETFEKFCFATVSPFIPWGEREKLEYKDTAICNDDTYSWSDSKLPSYISNLVWEIIKKFKLRSPPSDLIFLDRKTSGVFLFEAAIGAKFKGRDLLDKYIAIGLNRLK